MIPKQGGQSQNQAEDLNQLSSVSREVGLFGHMEHLTGGRLSQNQQLVQKLVNPEPCR